LSSLVVASRSRLEEGQNSEGEFVWSWRARSERDFTFDPHHLLEHKTDINTGSGINTPRQATNSCLLHRLGTYPTQL
jgi:hypothetical protein